MIKTLLTLFLILTLSTAAHAQTPALVKATFAGCNSDGQMGPMPAPANTGQAPLIPASAAPYLAFYAPAQGGRVLAPRGWYCFDYYGSNGDYLIVSPDPIYGKDTLTATPAITGPAIQITTSLTGTSGRFEAAAIFARLFPSQRQFVDSVIAENLEPASNFPFGPYPADIITRHSDTDVAYQTPANKTGMGTDSYFKPDNDPILGEAFIVDGAVITLNIRLPQNLRYLAPIIFNAERQSAKPPAP